MTDVAFVPSEHGTVGRVVQIDGEIVVETEDDSSQRVAGASLLHHHVFATKQHIAAYAFHMNHLSRAPFSDKISVGGEPGCAPRMMHDAALHDALWHDPLRVDIHALQGAHQQWRLRFQAATHHTHRKRFLLVLCHKVERRNVHHDISLMQIRLVGQSPPTSLHVDHDELAAIQARRVAMEHVFQPVVQGVARLHLIHKRPTLSLRTF